MTEDDGENEIDRDCRREPNPDFGFIDRIAIALFPFLEGIPIADREAGS